MLRTRPSLDWQILEDEEEWEAVTQTASQPEKQPAASTGRAAVAVAVCLAALLIAAGSALYRRADSNLARIDEELDRVVAVENWTQRHGNPDLANVLIDPQAPFVWKIWVHANHDHRHTAQASPAASIQDVQLAGEWAMVRVRIDEPVAEWQTGPYRETRFYRMSEAGWLRTAPRPEFWGDTITAETDYFQFSYWQRDAKAVAEVLADIDDQYAGLYAELGLEPDSEHNLLRIRVGPKDLISTDPGPFRFQGIWLSVPSPIQVPAPEEMTEADVLSASILEPLAVLILDRQMAKEQNWHHWQPLRDGLRLWIRQTHGALPSAYQDDLSRVLRTWRQTDTLQLSHLTAYNICCPWHPDDDTYNESRKAASRTVVSYAMQTYGHETLPSLIEAMGEHSSWEGLIPAAFGVTAAEFEQGWQEYLESEYP